MFVPYVPQERPEHYERRQVGVGLGRQTHFGAGRPIKHPRWNLQPTVRVGCSQVAAKDNSARPLNCLMSADPQAGPRMPRIKQLPKLGPVGVLKPCCTTTCVRIRASAISRRPSLWLNWQTQRPVMQRARSLRCVGLRALARCTTRSARSTCRKLGTPSQASRGPKKPGRSIPLAVSRS
jgi:hypothetical protein